MKTPSRGGAEPPRSISKQFLEGVLGFLGPLVHAAAAGPVAQREVKVLAEVRPVFFGHRLGSAFATLICHAAVVVDAIEAGAQVLVATVAVLASAGLPVEFPLPAAVVAMSVHFFHWPTAWPSAGLSSAALPSDWRICSAALMPVRPCFSRR